MGKLIAIEINPAYDRVRCGECGLLWRGVNPCPWRRIEEDIRYVRGPLCLAAEARIAAIRRKARVEALREVVNATVLTEYGYGNGYNEGHDDTVRSVSDAINAMIAKEEANG